MGSARTTPQVLAVMEEFIHQSVSREQIARETGLTPAQIMSAVNNMRSSGKFKINVLASGHAWVYHGPEHGESKPIWEGVTELKTGEWLLQDEEGNLWHARPINL
jgi:hypothetical protein